MLRGDNRNRQELRSPMNSPVSKQTSPLRVSEFASFFLCEISFYQFSLCDRLFQKSCLPAQWVTASVACPEPWDRLESWPETVACESLISCDISLSLPRTLIDMSKYERPSSPLHASHSQVVLCRSVASEPNGIDSSPSDPINIYLVYRYARHIHTYL